MRKFAKSVLSIILCVCMVITTMIYAVVPAYALPIEKQATKFVIHYAIKKIPCVGKTADSLFGSMLDKAIGLTEKSISLEDVSRQIEELSVKIDENQQQLLKQLYENQINAFYDKITKIKTQTATYYAQLDEIEKLFDQDSQDEYDKNLEAIKIANIINSRTAIFGDYVQNLGEVTSYITGKATGMNEGMLNMIYKVYCNDAVLGGEAAYLAQDNIQDVVTCVQNAYLIASTVLSAGIYVGSNYETYSALNESNKNGAFRSFANFVDEVESYTGSLNMLNSNYGSLFGGTERDTNRNYQVNESELDTEITEGVVGEYNDMVKSAYYYFIDSCDYSKKPVKINFIPLEREVKYVFASDYGYKNEKIEGKTDEITNLKDMGKKYKSAMEANRDSGLTRDQMNKLISHMTDSELFGTVESNEISIEQALMNYGFSFDNLNNHASELNLGSNVKKIFTDKVFSNFGSQMLSGNHRFSSGEICAYGLNLGTNITTTKLNYSEKNNLINYKYEELYRRSVITPGGYDDIVGVNFQIEEDNSLLGSIFGEGNVVIIISMIALLVAAGVVAIVVFKKKKQNDEMVSNYQPIVN
ncbi:MAG: hypothetical protein MJ125_03805 [Clostridia bacterium]|nr:hypothetical protein [Clostridia bacterium]